MKIKRALIVALMCGLAALMVTKSKTNRTGSSQASKLVEAGLPQTQSQVVVVPALAPERAAATEPEVGSETTSRATPENARGQTTGNAQNPAIATNPGSSPKEALRDPLARITLAFVGMDPEAEAYWYAAINDPSLPARERQDLIEDLNEDGLSDAKHPAMDNLPVIVSRLMIIEEVGSYAMDTVNANAFEEAYKDLVNLANVAMGGGAPVR